MTAASYGRTQSTLWGPTTVLTTNASSSNDAIEVSLHTLPKPLQREFHHVFNERNLPLEQIAAANAQSVAEFLAIPTNQHARLDLVGVGEPVEAEKDRLLNCFMVFATDVCGRLNAQGYWADYLDPCSGLPMLTRNCNKVYSEVDGMEACLGYRAYDAGFCKILTHPVWGSAVYPATMFCYAPKVAVLEVLASYPTVPDTSNYRAKR